MFSCVIFDFGNVLARFDTEQLTEGFGLCREDRDLIKKAVFDRKYWDLLDLGKIDDDACMEMYKEQLPPRLYEVADRVYQSWATSLPQIPGMEELCRALKEKGVRLYLLSDISKGFARTHAHYPVLSLFDGLVFSAEEGRMKPDEELFRTVLNRYHIPASESAFVDDRQANVDGAERVGITGILFDGDVEKLSRRLLG